MNPRNTFVCKKLNNSMFSGKDLGHWFVIAKLLRPCGTIFYLCRCECGIICHKERRQMLDERHKPCYRCQKEQVLNFTGEMWS